MSTCGDLGRPICTCAISQCHHCCHRYACLYPLCPSKPPAGTSTPVYVPINPNTITSVHTCVIQCHHLVTKAGLCICLSCPSGSSQWCMHTYLHAFCVPLPVHASMEMNANTCHAPVPPQGHVGMPLCLSAVSQNNHIVL